MPYYTRRPRPSPRATRVRRAHLCYRPEVRPLEPRLAPANAWTWNYIAGLGNLSNWSVAANWKNDTTGAQGVPANDDTVTFDGTSDTDSTNDLGIGLHAINIYLGYTHTITTTTNLQVTNGLMESGTIAGTALTIPANGVFTWNGPSDLTCARVDVLSGGRLRDVAGRDLTGLLTVAGTCEVSTDLFLLQAGRVIVSPGGELDLEGGSSILGVGGTVTNGGTTIKSGTDTTGVNVPFSNTGELDIQSGTLKFTNTAGQFGGRTMLSNGATLEAAGGNPYNVAAGDIVTAGTATVDGTLVMAGGTGLYPGGVAVGKLNVTGNLSFNGFYAVDIAGGVADEIVVGGTATLGGTVQQAGGPPPNEVTILQSAQLVGDFAVKTVGPYATKKVPVGANPSDYVLYIPVINVPGINVIEGQTITDQVIATSNDPVTPAATATISWNDGGSGTLAKVNGGDSGYTVTATHTFKEPPGTTFTLTVTDPSIPYSKQITGSVTVGEGAVAATGHTVQAFVGVPLEEAFASFTDAEAGTTPQDYNLGFCKHRLQLTNALPFVHYPELPRTPRPLTRTWPWLASSSSPRWSKRPSLGSATCSPTSRSACTSPNT